jgi:hypothetical protein
MEFTAYDGTTSLAGNINITIQENVTLSNGASASGIISDTDSVGYDGVFQDEKGLSFAQTGSINLYQSFTVSIDGGPFLPVAVSYSVGGQLWGTLGVYITRTWQGGIQGLLHPRLNTNVFVTGAPGDGGKSGIPLCGR